MNEHQHQKYLVDWLSIKKIFHFSIPNAQALSNQNKLMAMRVSKKLKSEGMVAGASDIVVMLENKILFIEMKKAPTLLKSQKLSYAGIKVSDSQKYFLAKVSTFKYAKSFVCYGWIEAKEVIENEIRNA